MYNLFRSFKKLLPQQWVIKHEINFRKLYGTLFLAKGNCLCSICQQKMKNFMVIDKNELLCPTCGSGKRHRRLFNILKDEINNGDNILDFSPNIGFAHYAKKTWGNNYFTSSYDKKVSADYHLNITDINLPDNAFDWVVCYHVLEHIPDDTKAMKELLRILKPGGKCIIQTPFKEGEIYEDFSITDPSDRLLHFHQEDHVRIYSVSGMEQRLTNVGFHVDKKAYYKKDHPYETEKLGYKEEEHIIFATKK